jgi:hypothetical protein
LPHAVALLVACQPAAHDDVCEAEPSAGVESACERSPFTVTLSDLLDEMTSLDGLARPALVPFRSGQASSYDRSSLSREEASWFANVDRGQFQGNEGGEHVLLEKDGPGVLTRLWSANPSGVFRVYVDGASLPALEAPLDDLLSGRLAPFHPPFSFVVGRGKNLYFPIAFQSHVKVTTTGEENLYYHVNYRTYPMGTTVESFSSRPLEGRTKSAYARAAQRLATMGPRKATNRSLTFDTRQPQWQSLEAKRAGAISELEVTTERLDAAFLRGTSIEMRFDGHMTVRAPLGDFFGSGPGLNSGDSLGWKTDAKTGTLLTRFVMPFRHTAEIRISSTVATSTLVRVRAHVDERAANEELLYFHAGWTGPINFDAEKPRDLTLMQAAGSGHFVGLVLNVANPDPQWWGEGDEKVYVDGEPFPSEFGTGTEDYFGYAWCSTELFTNAFVGQTRANHADNGGYVSLYRLRLLDRIPFQSALRFDFEALHWGMGVRSVSMSYDAVYFWYGDDVALDLSPDVPDADFSVPILPPGTVQVDSGPPTSC